jgi:hypothetical protein
MKTKLLSLMLFASVAFSNAQILLSENFDNITTLTTWTFTNQSSPVGSTGWFQGNSAVFNAQAGAATSYIGANFNNTSGANTISNWMITPQLLMQNGDVIKFWTRTTTGSAFPDRLEFRLSTGSTFTSPVTATTVGTFTTLLTSVNGPLTVGGYPDVWTEVSVTITGYSATPLAGNLAFRYFVTDAGPAGNNSDYMGIDTFTVTRPSLAVSNANNAKVSIYPNPATDYLKLNASSKISSVEIFDMSGKKVVTQLVDNTVDVKSLAKGSYVIKIQDQNGTSTQKFIKK